MKSLIIKSNRLIAEDSPIDQMFFTGRADRLSVRDIGTKGIRANLIKKLPEVYLNSILEQNTIALFFNNNQNNIVISLQRLILLNRLNTYSKNRLNIFFYKQTRRFLNLKFINKLKKKLKKTEILEFKKAQYLTNKILSYLKKKVLLKKKRN